MVQVLANSQDLVIFEYKNMFWNWNHTDPEVYPEGGIWRSLFYPKDLKYGDLNKQFTSEELLSMEKGAEALVDDRKENIRRALELQTIEQVNSALAIAYPAELDYFNHEIKKTVFKGVEGKNNPNVDIRQAVYI